MRAPLTRIWVTNGELGSDSNWRLEFAIHTPQGRAAMRRWTQRMADLHGKAAVAQTQHDWFNNTGKALYGATPTR